MASFDVKLDGADALIDKVGRMADNVRKQVSLAVEATALDVQDTARAEAPEDTGTLKRSIQVREVDDLTREVFTNVPYAAFQEFGYVGEVEVGAHTRVIDQAFGKAIAPTTVQVSAHTRTLNYPGWYYMTKGYLEGEKYFLVRVQRALQRAREAS